MVRTYLKVAIAAIAAFAFASCNNDLKVDSVQVSGETELVFTQEDTADKTVTFSANTDWTVSYEAAWLEVTPTSGVASEEIVLTVSLKETKAPVKRSDVVVINAGTAKAEVTVTQEATFFAEAIEVKGNHRVVAGYTTTLSVEATPAGAEIDAPAFETSDAAVVTVDANGVVTAVAVGEAVVTVTAGELVKEFWMEVTETFVTDGVGTTYTFADLAAIEYSGVEGANGEYVVTADIMVSETDIIALGDAKRVVFNDAVRLGVEGMADFVATEQISFAAAREAIPDPIYFTGDVEGAGSFKNIAFNGVTMRYFGAADLTVEDCVFTGVVDTEPCISLGGGGLVTVSNCDFTENAYPAINGAANIVTPLIFQDNYLYKNSLSAKNKPQINVTVGGQSGVKILRNVVIGPAEVTTNGGIAVSNMMSLVGSHVVEISDNEVSDNRYGIALYGQMNAVINDNVLMNNNYESNPMNGGSGVSLYGIGVQNVYMSGNHIEGHFWGITNIKYYANPNLNLGNLTEGDNYNPGGNVFVNNGNGGVLYDLYNNSTADVMAQGNIWNVDVQDEESIEGVIYHKVDQSNLGLVTFMPAGSAE